MSEVDDVLDALAVRNLLLLARTPVGEGPSTPVFMCTCRPSMSCRHGHAPEQGDVLERAREPSSPTRLGARSVMSRPLSVMAAAVRMEKP